jgi:TRAP-type C4-dicarboxylate transport system permease small subunit
VSIRITTLLNWLARTLAYAGGALAALLALMVVVSIAGRFFFARPIQGDVELTQMCIGICVACFLPWCQLHRGNIIIDFFTAKASPRTLQRLDVAGALLLALMLGFLAWRTGAGALSVRNAGEQTMILALPMWISYAALVPGMALAALIALMQALGALKGASA